MFDKYEMELRNRFVCVHLKSAFTQFGYQRLNPISYVIYKFIECATNIR